MSVGFVNQSIQLSFFFVCTKLLLSNLRKFSQIPMSDELFTKFRLKMDGI